MYTYGYLFYIPITLVFGIMFFINGIKKKYSKWYYWCAAMVVLYINVAIKISIFPIFIENIPGLDISCNINLNMRRR